MNPNRINELKREADNFVCLSLIKEHLRRHPYLRLEQVLWTLDNGQDFFNEEPEITYKRWKDILDGLSEPNV